MHSRIRRWSGGRLPDFRKPRVKSDVIPAIERCGWIATTEEGQWQFSSSAHT